MEGEEAAGVRSKVPPRFTLLLAPKKGKPSPGVGSLTVAQQLRSSESYGVCFITTPHTVIIFEFACVFVCFFTPLSLNKFIPTLGIRQWKLSVFAATL